MQPGQHRGLGAAQIVAERQPVDTTTHTAEHHLYLARGGGGGSGHWSGHATRLTLQSKLRKVACVHGGHFAELLLLHRPGGARDRADANAGLPGGSLWMCAESRLNRPRFYAHFLCWEGWRDVDQVRREHQGQGRAVGPLESTIEILKAA